MLIKIVVVIFSLGLFFAVRVSANEYYVSVSGNNSNDGSISYPWESVEYGLHHLLPGDTLMLMDGYHQIQPETIVTLSGTENLPITIKGIGDNVWLGNYHDEFAKTNNDQWERYAQTGLVGEVYRTKTSYSGNFVSAWNLESDLQLLEYNSVRTNYCNGWLNLLSSNTDPNGTGAVYQGPGIAFGPDNHLYLRTDLIPADSLDFYQNPIRYLRSNNPNELSLIIQTGNYSSNTLLNLTNSRYLNFSNLHLIGAQTLVELLNSDHIKFSANHFYHNEYGLLIRSGSNLSIENNHFHNGLPDYTYWTDVKNGPGECNEAAPEFQSFAIVGPLNSTVVSDNLFQDTMDGLLISGGASTQIRNNMFVRSRDDAINIGNNAVNINIYHNLFLQTTEALSTLSGGGEVYFHHNVIDDSQPQRIGRPGNYRFSPAYAEWGFISPFSRHGGDGGNWNIYNNTVLAGNGQRGFGLAALPNRRVYNNIFFAIDDVELFSSDEISDYQNNILWRTLPTLVPNPGPLDQILNPQINFPNRSINDFITTWESYRPNNSLVFSGAVVMPTEWPDSHGVVYRGAHEPIQLTPEPTNSSTPIPTPTYALTPTLEPADVNLDGRVDFHDYQKVVDSLNRHTSSEIDIDRDGKVTIFDLNRVIERI